MANFHIHKVNLQGADRHSYSEKLKDFESQFSYPLGEKRFTIVHGSTKENDYFSFFEQMGEVHYLVAETENKVVGAGCAVLRDSDEGKYWYLCDFKISEEYRGQGILETMFKNHFIWFAMKSRKLIAVNMGNGQINGNKLFSKIKRLLWMFDINAETLNFHTWQKNPEISHFHTYNNYGKKDLIIDGQPMSLNHLSPNALENFHNVEEGDEQGITMFCIKEKDDTFDKESISGKGVLISVGFKNPSISTAEI